VPLIVAGRAVAGEKMFEWRQRMSQDPSHRSAPRRLAIILAIGLTFASMPGVAQAQTQTQSQAQTNDTGETRLFFAPTARSLPAGQGYVGAWEIILPVAQVGVTDRFSFGGGLPWPAMVDGNAALWVTPKFEFYRGSRTSVAGGFVAGVAFGDGLGGLVYGVVTTGGAEGALSVAVFAPLSGHNENFPAIVMLGGEKRISNRLKFISENWILSEAGLVTGGVRVSSRRISADFALGVIIDSDHAVYAFPILNVMWKF
jgi:hypothetical protein